MPIDPRAFIFLGSNVLLLYLFQLVNSVLASSFIYLILLGPMLVFPALFMRHRSASFCLIITGIWIDTNIPATFGIFTISFYGLGTFLFLLRHRFRLEHNFHPHIIGQVINLLLILSLSFSNGWAHLLNKEIWIQTTSIILCSALCLFVISSWFFNFQRMLIELFHLNSEPEDLPIS